MASMRGKGRHVSGPGWRSPVVAGEPVGEPQANAEVVAADLSEEVAAPSPPVTDQPDQAAAVEQDRPASESQDQATAKDKDKATASDKDQPAPEDKAQAAAKDKDRPAPVGRRQRLSRWAVELAFVLLVVVVASFALKTFVIQSFWIPSHSMEQTLLPNDRVIVTKLAPRWLSLHRGDVVVFSDPGNWAPSASVPVVERGPVASWFYGIGQALGLAPTSSEEYLIKRVIGLPGDRVACEGDGAPITVNGVALDEPYLARGVAPSREAFEVVVPADAVWVMGDNRDNSADSRVHQDQALQGAVAIKEIVGVAQVRSWPLSRFSLMRNPGGTFAEVPKP